MLICNNHDPFDATVDAKVVVCNLGQGCGCLWVCQDVSIRFLE
jgi:hypothetical protein